MNQQKKSYRTSKSTPPLKIAAVHDISCIGRCAQTVIIPVLSAMGVQVCPLPTALLSTHTGGYTGFTFLDLTTEMNSITNHWDKLGTTFDAVYSGFLGSAEQIHSVYDFALKCKNNNPDCIFLADPVMGDDGNKYATYTDEMCRLTKKLVSCADIITPNITEACLLLDIPYKTDFSDNEIRNMLISLSEIGSESVIITGIHRINKVGAAYYSKKNSAFGEYFTKSDPNNYPGAGDIFSSIVLASFLQKQTLRNSVAKACDFILHASEYTTSLATPIREGLAIEALLSDLICDRKENQ